MSLSRVLFVSEARATRMRPPARAVLVSISDPGRAAIDFQPGWLDVLRLQFHDVDEVTFPGANPGLLAMSREQASAVAEFVERHRLTAQRLVVHCRSGISRSAGVAKAVAMHRGIAFPPDYAEFNVQVCRQVGVALATQAATHSRS
jgi:predicted protein tyrosine phosphatase